MYDYRYSSYLAKSGYNLLSYSQANKYQNLLLAYYHEHGGMTNLLAWKGASTCCVTVASGYRMTANSKSYVHTSPCGGTYLKTTKYKLLWSDGKGITVNGVHMKTSRTDTYEYPDPTYLTHLDAELTARGFQR